MIKPGDKLPYGDQKWVGEKPMYAIAYCHPRNEPGMCDVHWFELDVVNVEVETATPEKTPALIPGTIVPQKINH